MKNFSQNSLKVPLMAVLMAVAAILQSCSKSQVKENAPVANIINPNIVNSTSQSFPAKPNGIDSTIFKDIVAYWPLYHNANDYSGNENNGVEHSVTAPNSFYGTTFNGTSSYIAMPDVPSLRLNNTDFTISASFYLNSYSTSPESEILDKRGSGANNGWHLAIAGKNSRNRGHLIFTTGDGSIIAMSKDTIQTNYRYMVDVMYYASINTVKIYLYDVFLQTISLDTTVRHITTPVATNNAKLYIGRSNPAKGGAESFFNGDIHGIRIFTRDITQGEAVRLAHIVPIDDAFDNLIAYWPLARNANDLSLHHNNGILHNVTATTDRFGNAVGACSFNGKNSYISVNDTPALRLSINYFTLNAWVKVTGYDTSVGSEIISKRLPAANSGWAWSIVGDAGTPVGAISFTPGRGIHAVFGTNPLPLNSWHMVTVVYNYHTVYTYIDGVLDNTVYNINSPNEAINALMYIGSNGDTMGGAHYFKGSLSNIRIFSTALTSNNLWYLLTAFN